MNALQKALSGVSADALLKSDTAAFIKSQSAVVPLTPVAGTGNKRILKRIFAVACAAVLFCALPAGAYAYYKTPTSYVSVDINPSVELGINAFGVVVSVTPYNDDGKTIIEGLSLVNLDVGEAVKQLVVSASDHGFIMDDGSTLIAVTAESNNDKTAEQLQEEAKEGAEDAVSGENNTAAVQAEAIGLARRDRALALGITPGKLNLIEKLQALDPTIKVEDYKDASVTEIQKKYTELKREQHQNGQDADESESSDTDETPDESPAVTNTDDAIETEKPGNTDKHENSGETEKNHAKSEQNSQKHNEDEKATRSTNKPSDHDDEENDDDSN
ncbi:hypothetical protein IZU99_06050 [Oscillospiraceae bacterium CM]|nr:hypothetical protein IZU99_06050 [Oscillospiraceae bacterium CM]